MTEVHPSSWKVSDVEAWARKVNLSADTVEVLKGNQVDGPTLVTLQKDELKSELGIASLPARRYLWDLIQTLRSQQDASDLSVAIQFHQLEIEELCNHHAAADASGGASPPVDPEVVTQLRSDAAQQRQILEDHLVALKMQSAAGMQTYEDAELARTEEERLRQLAIQSEFDHRYALSLDGRRSRRNSASSVSTTRDEVASLFGLAINACVQNRVNVAEALEKGDIRLIRRLQDIEAEASFDQSVSDLGEMPDLEPSNPASNESAPTFPLITRCESCYDEQVRGVDLACEHMFCVGCMRSLFRTALGDSSLLPLRCCEVPIDMNIGHDILEPDEADLLISRMTELEATNKMYCPSCSRFINLDLVDATDSSDLICVCSAILCVSCKTVGHNDMSCETNLRRQRVGEEEVLALAERDGWKRCPGCRAMIELTMGCNHITCALCSHEFCFNCLRPWDTGRGICSSGGCAVWEEDRLRIASA